MPSKESTTWNSATYRRGNASPTMPMNTDGVVKGSRPIVGVITIITMVLMPVVVAVVVEEAEDSLTEAVVEEEVGSLTEEVGITINVVVHNIKIRARAHRGEVGEIAIDERKNYSKDIYPRICSRRYDCPPRL